MTEKTTIQLTKDTKALLDDERLPTEGSYDETVRRLLGAQEGQMWTREEIRAIAKETFRDEARR